MNQEISPGPSSGNAFSVAIIGGGFCGTMLAVHLMQQRQVPVQIYLVNAGYPLSRGAAFSSYSHNHLLNVAARNMSAFADKPAHFLQWINRHENYGVIDPVRLPDMYLPRNVYGYYLKDVFDSAIRNKPENVNISFIHDEAIDIEIISGKAKVYFSMSPSIETSWAALCTGNEMPAPPPLQESSFYTSRNYFGNPWLHEAVTHLDPEKNVLIIGNGLTMVDVVIGLKEKGHRGKIYSLSPNGFKILPHREFSTYTGLTEELTEPYDLAKLVRLVRKHIRKLRSEDKSAEAIVDSLRPLTQTIWQTWTLRERKRFLFHIRHMWGMARHRLPMQVHMQIQQYILDHTLEIIAGRLLSISEDDAGIQVVFRRRSNQQECGITVGRVINCTGPRTDITQLDRKLYANLLQRGLIRPDELKLGIDARSDGAVKDEKGNASEILYTIGSPMKGVLWESTAVPELRLQARNLAGIILNACNRENMVAV